MIRRVRHRLFRRANRFHYKLAWKYLTPRVIEDAKKAEARRYVSLINLEMRRHAQCTPERLILNKIWEQADSQMFTKDYGHRP